MKVDIGNMTYAVSFSRSLCPSARPGENGKKVSIISCNIYALDPDNNRRVTDAVGLGTAKQHYKDQPNDVIGRKIAFQRALANGKFGRKDRTSFWDSYKEKCRYICRLPR